MNERVKVYRVEVMVVDHDRIGEEALRNVIEDARYPNRCIAPRVMDIESREIDWSDDCDLNHSGARGDAAYVALFHQEGR